MKSYNVGIVGFGFMGKVHAHGHINLPLYYDPQPCEARITHICDVSSEVAQKGKDQIGAEVATTDLRQITENPAIDIVHICTPNNYHKEALLSAIRHQKHVYCDKPIVATMDEAEEVRSALADYKGVAQMAFQSRFFPATMRARQLIDEGFLGKVLTFRARYLHSGSADPNAPLKWKLSAASGGGVIADLGSHALDLMHWLLGDYAELSAASSIAYPERPAYGEPGKKVKVEAEDCVMVIARMASGALGTIEATKLATGTEDETIFEIHGPKGALRFNGMRPHYLEAYESGASSTPIGGMRGWTSIDTGQRYPKPAVTFPGPKFCIGCNRSHMACLASFLSCVADGRPAEPSLAHGIHVQELMEACRRSVREGCWVKL